MLTTVPLLSFAMSLKLQQHDIDRWDEEGVLVLRNFFDTDQVDAVNDAVDKLWQDRGALVPKIVIDTHIQSVRSFRQLLKYASLETRRHPYKINDLYLENPAIRAMSLNSSLCEHLTELLGGTPMAFNSLNFEHGSQQNNHRDTLFMPSRLPNKMLGSWIALEEVSTVNGPIHYYPGSHKIPPFRFSNGKQNAVAAELHEFDAYMSAAIRERSIEPVAFEAGAGDVLIWHAELLHGGAAIVNKHSTRKSLVTHYYRKQDYWHRFWQIRREHGKGYFLKRSHQAVRI